MEEYQQYLREVGYVPVVSKIFTIEWLPKDVPTQSLNTMRYVPYDYVILKGTVDLNTVQLSQVDLI